MKSKILNITFLTLIISSCSINLSDNKAQDKKESYVSTICLACGISARPDAIFEEYKSLVDTRSYYAIIQNLYDLRPAYQLLSIMCLEKLESKGELKIDKNTKRRIDYLKSSSNGITFAFGCTDFDGPVYRFSSIFQGKIPYNFYADDLKALNRYVDKNVIWDFTK